MHLKVLHVGVLAAVFVGQAKDWVDEIKAGFENVPQVWMMLTRLTLQTSKAAKDRILSLIASGKAQGATCLIDGSDFTVEVTSKVTGLVQRHLLM